MSQKGITINTLNDGQVDASDHALLFNATFGDCGILNIGNKLKLSKISNNKVRMLNGFYMMSNGVIIRVEGFEDIDITSGTLGQKRIDLIIAEYVKNGDKVGQDIAKIKVLSGKYSSTTAVAPTLTKNDVTRQELIATLNINETDMTIKSFDAKVLPNFKKALTVLSESDDYIEVDYTL